MSLLLERPLPIRDLGRVDAELVGLIPASDVLVEQGSPALELSGAEKHDAVDRVDRMLLVAGRASGTMLLLYSKAGDTPDALSRTCTPVKNV